jgi:hypothetical protein
MRPESLLKRSEAQILSQTAAMRSDLNHLFRIRRHTPIFLLHPTQRTGSGVHGSYDGTHAKNSADGRGTSLCVLFTWIRRAAMALQGWISRCGGRLVAPISAPPNHRLAPPSSSLPRVAKGSIRAPRLERDYHIRTEHADVANHLLRIRRRRGRMRKEQGKPRILQITASL